MRHMYDSVGVAGEHGRRVVNKRRDGRAREWRDGDTRRYTGR